MTGTASPSTSDRIGDEDAAAVRALVDAAAQADGIAPVSEQILINLRHGGPGILHVLARAGGGAGSVAGYAQLDTSGDGAATAELVVDPRSRRQGIGTVLVDEVVARAGGPVEVWAHGEHPGAARLAATHDMAKVRELWQMRRELTEPLPAAAFPEGVELRAYEPGRDEAEFLRVNNAAFDWHPEQGGWTHEQVARREAEPWFDPAGFLLAVEGDRLLGYHWTKVHPAGPEGPAIGEVYVLGVDPAAQGRRLGGALTIAGLEHLRSQGLDAVMLYVESDNDPAVAVYRRLGFTPWRVHSMYRN
ncbi:mycothiol synthase [Pseudonocardia sp.]|uniref:mycothiol synthase n=1 Tax=Pseudonocardia sp. TaxID=60912 RepID=UPI003D0DFA75